MKNKLVQTLLFWIVVLVTSGVVYGEKVATLEEVGKPERFVFGNGYMYLLEGTTIHIYDGKSFKYIKKFGKEGEGPKEIKRNAFGGPIGVMPYKGDVVITSSAKVSYYNKLGEYIKEFKVWQFDSYYPYADGYACISQTPVKGSKNSSVLAVFHADKKFKKGKVLYVSDFRVGQNLKWKFPIKAFYPVPAGEEVFVIAGKEGFSIRRFDAKGNLIGTIKKEIPKVPLPPSYKKKTIKWFKSDPTYKNAWGFFKDRIDFQSHYPSIYGLFIGKNRLYAMTSKTKGDERECIVMDFNGKEIKRLYIYGPELFGMDFRFVAAIHDNHYYWIVENEDEEMWELHRKKIE